MFRDVPMFLFIEDEKALVPILVHIQLSSLQNLEQGQEITTQIGFKVLGTPQATVIKTNNDNCRVVGKIKSNFPIFLTNCSQTT